ncbi:MAG: SDR family NAD(P)-dependent oxidoreductase [Candidatus Marinimicrobia bacterium]|jgi:3-oxoacyl-[acyl-carrier protein] reductase|nr:SDR family NAD(P)-dependent oxidoreductase [Candidatus Neomarinimicrobiota bacterium]MDP6725630.1 SDR family NAD(P)-dependent oxidoreductase [Candidatus Neomarinimicrobiota bacterium]|tara:strand:+ start:14126 stop:14875 length:750 start_codon:yes stop_codon:yes gene_type:complete
MIKTLDGKIALVTGGSSGIGTAIAQSFAQAGAHVAFTYHSNKEGAESVLAEIEAMGVKGAYFQADMADFAKAQEVVDQVNEKFGTLDILVNNAGANQDKVVWKMTETMWDEVIDTDLKGVFNYIRAASPNFREKKYGRIITVSSINALRGKFGQSNYAAAKAGVIGLSKSVAKELGRSNVTVNVVCPGLIATKMIQSMPDDFKEKAMEEIVLGRIGTPEDVAEVITFLSGDGAKHITGEVIKVDGGQYI